MRKLLETSLEHAGFDVVATARDGDEALALCMRLRPDVMTLDLAMPGTDGIAVLRTLRARRQALPVVVVSAFSAEHGARAVDALAEGAFDLVAKPAGGMPLHEFGATLATVVTTAADSRRAPAAVAPTAAPAAAPRAVRRVRRVTGAGRVVVIACSTGGPRALGDLVPALPGTLGA